MHNNALALFAIKFSSTKKKVLFRIGGGGGGTSAGGDIPLPVSIPGCSKQRAMRGTRTDTLDPHENKQSLFLT